MIRSETLIDKLVADLHYHNFLFVNEGDNIFTDQNEHISNIEKMLAILGLGGVLNPHTDFFHGGTVITQSKIDHIYDYIDDVYIDYFFRTHNFHPIVIPNGLCDEQITPTGIIHPDENREVVLNLNNIYDRCTFVVLIFRLFALKSSKLYKLFQNNSFINGLHRANKKSCDIIENIYPYGDELQLYIERNYKVRAKFKPTLRAEEIFAYNRFYEENEYQFEYHGLSCELIHNYWKIKNDYILIKDKHIFGEYSIEDVLIIYSLLIDQFVLSEEKLITFLSPYLDIHRNNSIWNEFRKFENSHTDYHEIEQFIHPNDLYLRFASRKRSKAFKFNRLDDLFEYIQVFDQQPIPALVYNNPIQLPFLYNSLKLY